MSRQPLIVLIGDSLLMEGVALNLTGRPQLTVLRLEPALVEMKNCLECLKPDLTVFEEGAPWSESLLSILDREPESRLRGLGVNAYRLVVHFGDHFHPETMEELLEVIRQQTGYRRLPRGG